jgi:hypothetical protein
VELLTYAYAMVGQHTVGSKPTVILQLTANISGVLSIEKVGGVVGWKVTSQVTWSALNFSGAASIWVV